MSLLYKLSKVALVSFSVITYFFEQKKPNKNYKNTLEHDLKNLALGSINKMVGALIVSKTYDVFELTEKRDFGLIAKLNNKPIQKFILALMLIDLWMYFWHRLNHENNFLWNFHKFHHKDTQMNTSSAINFHTFEIIISTFARIIIFIPLGIERKHLSLYETLLLPIIIFHHANIQIKDNLDDSLSLVISTPAFHRVHHSKNMEETNSNYASILTIWDKLFGSHIPNKASNIIDYGI